MSRSGYSDDDEGKTLGLWRRAVKLSIKGKRGQAMLRELLSALDAMPVKSLAAESLITADGEFCTLGALGAARGLDLHALDPEDWDAVAKAFGVAPALVREVVYMNDESLATCDWVDIEICGPLLPWEYGQHHRTVRVDIPAAEMGARRWAAMRAWVATQLPPAHTEVPANV